MKKSLIALAALATVATVAQAQSSVTIYGVMDAGITSASKIGSVASNSRVTGLTNGGLSTPRLGFRGNEDLGGGLKASFTLENEILMDTGAQGDASYLFNRGAWVGLAQDGVGSMRAGRINRIDYDFGAKYDAFGGNNIGGWIALKDSNSNSTGEVSLKVGERIANAVEVKSANFGGLVVTLQTAFGENAGNDAKDKTMAIGAEYTSGKFMIAAAQAEKDSLVTHGKKTKNTSFYSSYDFGVAKVTGGYNKQETDGTAAQPSGYFVGTRVPVAKHTTVIAQYASLDADTTAEKAKVYSLGATYDFSKRTTAYLIGARNNGTGQTMVSSSKYSGFQSVANLNAMVYSVGLRHTF